MTVEPDKEQSAAVQSKPMKVSQMFAIAMLVVLSVAMIPIVIWGAAAIGVMFLPHH